MSIAHSGDMRLKLLLAIALLVPLAVRTAAAIPQAGPRNAAFDTMATNVGKITDMSEKGRWQANVDMWRVRLARSGALTPADVDKLQECFDAMKANVSAITVAGERNRWHANVDLWEAVIAHPRTMSPADVDAAKSSIARMKMIVSLLKAGDEKERWQANVDLWQAFIEPLN